MNLFSAIAGKVAGLWNGEIEPALVSLLHTISHDAITALVPIATAAAAELPAIAVENATLSQKVAQIGAIATATALKVEQTALQVTEQDVAAAAVAAVAHIQVGAAAPAPAPAAAPSA